MGDGMSDGAICGWRDGHTCHLPVGHGGPCDNDSSTPAGEIKPDVCVCGHGPECHEGYGCSAEDCGCDQYRQGADSSTPASEMKPAVCPRCGSDVCAGAIAPTAELRAYAKAMCDEVAALRASLKQARAARDTWHERCNDVVEQRDALHAELKAMTALHDELEVFHEHNMKLVGENHVLRAERDEARERSKGYTLRMRQAEAERDSLRAEADRLEAECIEAYAQIQQERVDERARIERILKDKRESLLGGDLRPTLAAIRGGDDA